MKVIIKIGYVEILLPDESGVQTLLKCLGKGIQVRDRLYDGKILIEKEELKLEFKTVPATAKFMHKEEDEEEQEINPFPNQRAMRINGVPQRLLLNG